MSENEQKKELNIKDLSIKLQILTNALIEERQKSSTYVSKIKDFEQMIIKKDSEIANINKAKFDIQSSLSLEKKNKKEKSDLKLDKVVSFFNKDKIDFDLFDKMKEENSALKFEYKELQKKWTEARETGDQQKMKYDTMMALQEKQIKDSEERITKLNQEQIEQEKNNQTLLTLIEGLDNEKAQCEQRYKELENEINQNDEKVTQVMMDNVKATSELKPKQEKIKELQKRLKEQTNTLNEMKNQITQIVLEPQEFQCMKEESVFKKLKVQVTMKQNELDQKYNLYIDFLEGKDKEQEVIDFLDVTKGEIDSKKFIISLTEKNGKTQKVTLILEELLIDFFAQNFMEFLEKARDSVL